MDINIENMRLTQTHEEQMDMDEVTDHSTSGLVEYGLRNGCLDSEYHLANRLQKMRHIALRLAKELESYGGDIANKDLEAIDVMVEVTTEKRLCSAED